MELFDPAGHLTDATLDALIQGDALPELNRLEVSEHLAYCDTCLVRYTARLTGEALLSPAHSCRETLWWRIRGRMLRIVTDRYATAVAGLALMVAVLWSGIGPNCIDTPRFPEALPPLFQQLQAWPEQWSNALGGAFSQLNGLFDQLDGGAESPQGGTHL